MADVVSFWASASPLAAAAGSANATTARVPSHAAQCDLPLRMLRITCKPPRPAPSLRDVVAPPLMADRGKYHQKIVSPCNRFGGGLTCTAGNAGCRSKLRATPLARHLTRRKK